MEQGADTEQKTAVVAKIAELMRLGRSGEVATRITPANTDTGNIAPCSQPRILGIVASARTEFESIVNDATRSCGHDWTTLRRSRGLRVVLIEQCLVASNSAERLVHGGGMERLCGERHFQADPGVLNSGGRRAESCKGRDHLFVAGGDLSAEPLNAVLSGSFDERLQEQASEAKSLVLVDDGDGDLGYRRVGPVANVSGDADAKVIGIIDEFDAPREMIEVVDLCEVGEFPLGEIRLWGEEA